MFSIKGLFRAIMEPLFSIQGLFQAIMELLCLCYLKASKSHLTAWTGCENVN